MEATRNTKIGAALAALIAVLVVLLTLRADLKRLNGQWRERTAPVLQAAKDTAAQLTGAQCVAPIDLQATP